MILYALEFIKNLFSNIPDKVGLGLLFLEQVCRLSVYVLICHFFLKASASLIGKSRVKKWRKAINVFFIIVTSFLAFLLAYYIFLIIDPSNEEKNACHTYEFMIQETLLLVVMICFSIACSVIDRVI